MENTDNQNEEKTSLSNQAINKQKSYADSLVVI